VTYRVRPPIDKKIRGKPLKPRVKKSDTATLRYRNNTVERQMLDTLFSGTKEVVTSNLMLTDSKKDLRSRDTVAWLDPCLAEAADRLFIY
jgi:hypothetical protein